MVESLLFLVISRPEIFLIKEINLLNYLKEFDTAILIKWYWLDAEQKAVICHERLSIVGVSSGSQPIHNKDLGIVLSVNGEIYNYKTLYRDVLYNKYTPQTESDCEVIIYLYKEYGPLCVKMLDGIFGFVLFDTVNQKVLVARDPIGIIPLYWGVTESNEIYFASELKSIHDQCVKGDGVNVFPPSNYYVSDLENVGMVSDNNLANILSDGGNGWLSRKVQN